MNEIFHKDKLKVSFDTCFTFENLVEASYKCEKGVSWKRQVQYFKNDRFCRVVELLEDLKNGTYKLEGCDQFHIIERGKPRDVKSIHVRDRVVQRCLSDNILVPVLLDNLVEENSACIKGRGLSYAFDRVVNHLKNVNIDGWILQFDFHDYFHTINHEILLKNLRKIIDDDRVFDLLELIIEDENPGLELGSQISQLCAVFYLNDMDREMINNSVGYHRYMDDGIIFCKDKKQLNECFEILNKYVDNYGLTLNENKLVRKRAKDSFVFCKMRFKKIPDGVKMNVPKKSSRKSKKHMKGVFKKVVTGKVKNYESVYNASLGYLNRGCKDLTSTVEQYKPGEEVKYRDNDPYGHIQGFLRDHFKNFELELKKSLRTRYSNQIEISSMKLPDIDTEDGTSELLVINDKFLEENIPIYVDYTHFYGNITKDKMMLINEILEELEKLDEYLTIPGMIVL